MSSATTSAGKEVYGETVRFRLASEFWRIEDELMPQVLAAVEYLSQSKVIDEEWRLMIHELGMSSLRLKYSILGFKSLLTKEDGDSIRPFATCYALSIEREGRRTVSTGVMDGRPEIFAKRRLQLEDTAIALYLQAMDIRAVAFKNNTWDISHRPTTRPHGTQRPQP